MDQQEQGNLRLVPENSLTQAASKIEKQFVSFIFFRIDPSWRKLDEEKKSILRREFQGVHDSYSEDFLLYSYSLVGFDSKADLMLWRIGDSLDPIQEMTAKLFRTGLGSYLETAENFLAVTKKMAFIRDDGLGDPKDRSHVIAGAGKYHFVYPCAKQAEWFDKSAEERDELISENFMVGKKFPNIRIHLTHAFGFSEQEYVISFETDEPRDFLTLAEELRQTTASKLTYRGMPIFTCRRRSLSECLEALG
ncbi:MAG TPA: chlorite dismutase family protein [Pyrinomonadaceae bacterium]|nr:chlorite dismutase family protein [Pyrinomonadaceae bacterium]